MPGFSPAKNHNPLRTHLGMPNYRHIIRCSLAALVGVNLRPAHAAMSEKPQTLKLELGELYLRTDNQYENDSQTAGTPAAVFTRNETIVEPVVGIGVTGSMYHPDLVQFRLHTELGASWEDAQVNPGGGTRGTKFLQRYDGSVDILNEKPYATSFYGDKDMTYRDYDFFSRVRVDSEEYGARTGYSAGPVPFSIGVQHYDESEEDALRPRDFRQDTFNFNAQNRRKTSEGTTRLSYSLNDFTRKDDGFNTTHGLAQNLNLTDNEKFGGREQTQLTSLLNWASLTDTLVPTDQLLLQEDLRLQHTRRLDSYYDYSFDTSSAGGSYADTHDAHAGVDYQWLPDLTSGAEVLGNLTSASSPGSSLESRYCGAGANIQYTPALSTWGQLAVSDNAQWQHNDRDAGGRVQNIVGEPHALTDGKVVLLAQPAVAAGTIHVWGDTAHSISYVEGLDYLLIPHGSLTEIQRIPGGTIPNGGSVFVDYSATLQGTASYDELDNHAAFRLDLWSGLLGIYGSWAYQTYEGGELLLLRTLDDKTIGADSTWRWFRVGAEYETVDSNLAPYNRTRFTQSAIFRPGHNTDVSLNADEGWTDFTDSHLREASYGFIGRLQQQLTTHLSGGAEAGLRFDRGDTFDRTLTTCRLWLDWNVGRLTVKASYQFNDEYHLADREDRHFLFVSIRRDFR